MKRNSLCKYLERGLPPGLSIPGPATTLLLLLILTGAGPGTYAQVAEPPPKPPETIQPNGSREREVDESGPAPADPVPERRPNREAPRSPETGRSPQPSPSSPPDTFEQSGVRGESSGSDDAGRHPNATRTTPPAREASGRETNPSRSPRPAAPAVAESPAAAPPPGEQAPVIVPAAQGMADELPAFDRELLPGYEDLRKAPADYPHLDEETRELASETDALVPANDGSENAGDESKADSGKGWFRTLYESIWVDRTVRNGLLVITLILVFIIYRMRTGRSRKGYL